MHLDDAFPFDIGVVAWCDGHISWSNGRGQTGLDLIQKGNIVEASQLDTEHRVLDKTCAEWRRMRFCTREPQPDIILVG